MSIRLLHSAHAVRTHLSAYQFARSLRRGPYFTLSLTKISSCATAAETESKRTLARTLAPKLRAGSYFPSFASTAAGPSGRWPRSWRPAMCWAS